MKIVKLADIQGLPTAHKTGKKKVMIQKGEVNSLTQFAQAVFQPGEVAAEHKHTDIYEIFFIEQGTGIIRINGKKFSLEKGMCITIEPDELHEITNTGKEELIIIYFGILKS